MEEALYINEDNDSVFVKATGHITAAICDGLRKRVYGRLKVKEIPHKLVVDLSECDYMDSTFMGLLVGFNKKFQIVSGKRLVLANPSQECLDLLQKLGVLALLSVDDHYEENFPDQMELISKTEGPTVKFILQTHTDLSDISPENRKRFSTLTEILKQQIKKEES